MKDESHRRGKAVSGAPHRRQNERSEAPPDAPIVLRQIDASAPPFRGIARERPVTGAHVGIGTASAFAELDWLDTIIDVALQVNPSRSVAARLPPTPQRAPTSAATEFADLSISPDASGVLNQVVLGYSPIIDQARGVIGTRLTVAPVSKALVLHAGALLEAVDEVWPNQRDLVCLNVTSDSLLADLLHARPSANVMIEIPVSLAENPCHRDALIQLAQSGTQLLIKGQPSKPLPRELLPCFRMSVIDLAEDRRGPDVAPQPGVSRAIPHLQSGVRTMAELRRSFSLGATAVIGWPLHEPLSDALAASPDMRVVLDMIERMDSGQSAQSIDQVLMRDPVLAFELLSHLNGSADHSFEAGSMRHAISIMGHDNLRRWLSHLLTRSVDEIHLRPANFAALRRGLLLRMLAPAIGDPEARGELFMCGVFSLLDRIYARPVGELVRRMAVPERVRAALVDRGGPFFPLLELVRAIESENLDAVLISAESLLMPPIEVNKALMRSLLVATQLECGQRFGSA